MKSRLSGLLAVTALIGFGGCASFQDISHQTSTMRRARQEYKVVVNGDADKHFRDGWQTGYVDVASGSGGKPRPLAPSKYFTPRYQNPAGEQHLENWTCGYKAGVEYALSIDAARYQFVPTLAGASLPTSDPVLPDWYFANLQGVDDGAVNGDRENIIKPIEVMPEDDSPKGKSDSDSPDGSELPKPNLPQAAPASVPAVQSDRFDADAKMHHAKEPSGLRTARRELSKVETLPAQTLPGKIASGETQPVKTVSVEKLPVQSVPITAVPATKLSSQDLLAPSARIQRRPIETVPVETVPVETVPVETVPVETVPVETVPVETAPVEDVPIERVPVPAVPAQHVPIERVPSQTVPVQTVPLSNSMPLGKTQPARLKLDTADLVPVSDDTGEMVPRILRYGTPAITEVADPESDHELPVIVEKDLSSVFPASVNIEERVPRILREIPKTVPGAALKWESNKRQTSRRTDR